MSDKTAFTTPLLSKEETKQLLSVCGELGPDPSSKDFVTRTKNIAFVVCISGRWFQINHNYVNQPSFYNNISGGYRRYYRELPREFILSKVTQRILSTFKQIYNIPEGELVIVQVQTSHIRPGDESECLTGHGIHSDGADKAFLICLERKNIQGARSAIYADHDGLEPVLRPFILEEGQALFWEDNSVYHDVESAKVEKGAKTGCRTVIVGNYPAIQFIYGTKNPNNTLSVESKRKAINEVPSTNAKEGCVETSKAGYL